MTWPSRERFFNTNQTRIFRILGDWRKNFRATLHPTELNCILFLAPLYPLSYTAPSGLCCTSLSCACILLSYNIPYWAKLHPVELWCSLLSYPFPPYWSMLYPSELRCTFWAMLHLNEPRRTLLSYAAPYWATLHGIHQAPLRPFELRCTLLSYTAHPYELAHPNWASLHHAELRWALQSYAVPCELHYSLTELTFSTRTVPLRLCNFVKCRNAGLSGMPEYRCGGIDLDADAQLCAFLS
jgi:hypothetical protein